MTVDLPHFFIKHNNSFALDYSSDRSILRKAVDASHLGAVCLVGDKGQLIGICSDADLRKDKEDPVNYEPLTISEDSSRVGLTREFIPVIGKEGNLSGVLFRPGVQVLDLVGDEKCVTIVGVGYVGLTLAIALASQGVRVTAIDKRSELIELLRNGVMPISETGIESIFNNCSDLIEFRETTSIHEIGTKIVIVTVGTPLDSFGKVNLSYVTEVIEYIESKREVSEMVVVLRSTVPVGTADKIQRSLELSGSDTKVVVAPERTIEGRAIDELFTNPQIIGSDNMLAALAVYKLFSRLTSAIKIFPGTSFAELAKLADNTYRDMHFAYSNFFCRIAAEFNVHGSSIIDAVNKGYARNNISSPSIGVGGPCLSKDAYLFMHGISSLGSHFESDEFILSGRKQDDILLRWLSKRILEHSEKIQSKKVAVVGLAFKGYPPTGDTRDSSAIKLIESLPQHLEVAIFDPLVQESVCSREFSTDAKFAEVLHGAGIVVVMYQSPWIQRCDWGSGIASLAKGALFVDGSGRLSEQVYAVKSEITYFSL